MPRWRRYLKIAWVISGPKELASVLLAGTRPPSGADSRWDGDASECGFRLDRDTERVARKGRAARVAPPVHPDFLQCPVVANPQLGCLGVVTELPACLGGADLFPWSQLAVW